MPVYRVVYSASVDDMVLVHAPDETSAEDIVTQHIYQAFPGANIDYLSIEPSEEVSTESVPLTIRNK